MKSSQILFVGALALVSGVASTQAQTTYNYVGTTGGTWSTPANWSPSGPPSTSSDTADLNNVTAMQTVLYDTSASGVLGTLNITETSAFVNELTLQRTLTLTNSLTLGTTAGTAELATGTTAASFALSVGTSGTINLNSGGELALGGSNTAITAASTTVASGGTLATLGTTAANGGQIFSGTLTINSGGVLTAATNSSIVVTGNFTMDGTATNTNNFASNTSASTGLVLNGTTNVIAPSNGTAFKNVVLDNKGSTSTTVQLQGALNVRTYNTGTNELSSTYAGSGAQIAGSILLADNTSGTTGGTGTFQLGSNLSSSGTIGVATFSQGTTLSGSTGTVKLAVDTNGFTLDFSTFGTSAFTPVNANNSGTAISTLWTLTDSTSTTGKIMAPSFVLSSPTGGVTVANTITLQATGGNSTANNLQNTTGTIAATSTFLYSGTAAAATPATLTSTRAIGNLAVQTGNLQLLSAITAAGASVVVNGGGTLDVNANALTATAGALTLADTTGIGTIRNSSSTSAMVSAASMTFNPGGTLTYSLSTTANSTNLMVALTGALTQGTTGTGSGYNIALSGGLAGQTYELASFGSTTFAASAFTDVGSVPGTFFVGLVNGIDQLDFTVSTVPEPNTWISGLLCVGMVSLVARKRMRRAA